MAHDVFISHSAQNREVADAICTALEKGGVRCWVAPRDVRPGLSFPGEITRAIQHSKVMLLIFSRHSNNSEQVLREVQLATDSRLPLIRFRIEDVSMNDDLKYFLSTPHWLDALTPPLSTHIDRLENAIKELLGQSVEVTGKDVTAETERFAPPPMPAVSPTASVPPPPPPPKELITARDPAPVPRSAVAVSSGPVKRKSAAPWILLGVAGLVVVLGIVFFVFLLALKHPNATETVQVSEATPQPIAKVESTPSSTPVRVAKTKQKPAAQRQTKSTRSTEEAENSNQSKNESAFERAGALKPENQTEDEQKSTNPFDRAGSGADSDDEDDSAEPTPDDE